MTALDTGVRELSFAEIDMVSGGNWFSDALSAFGSLLASAVDVMVSTVEDALIWLNQYFIVTVDNDGGVTVRNR